MIFWVFSLIEERANSRVNSASKSLSVSVELTTESTGEFAEDESYGSKSYGNSAGKAKLGTQLLKFSLFMSNPLPSTVSAIAKLEREEGHCERERERLECWRQGGFIKVSGSIEFKNSEGWGLGKKMINGQDYYNYGSRF